jgi:outer membrane protein TolC
MFRLFPLLALVCCLVQTSPASAQAGMPGQQTDPVQNPPPQKSGPAQNPATQNPANQPAVPPLTPPKQQGGPIPPRDPRLPPPKVQETNVLPNVTVPPAPAGSVTGDISVHPITADDAARIALRLQPNISIAQGGITVQKGRTRQIKSGLMPQVTLVGGYTYVQNIAQPGSGPAIGNSAGTTGTGGTGSTGTGGSGKTTTEISSPTGGEIVISQGALLEATLHQLIYDFNHTVNLVRQSVELEKAATQNLTRVQSDTVLDVKQAFYQYVQNLKQVQVEEQDVANRQAQLDLAQARYNVGLGVQSDIISAQTAKAEAIESLSQAQVNAEQAHFNLAILIGIDPRTPIVPANTSEPPNPSNDVNVLTQQALTHRPEVVQARYNLRSTQYGVSAARSTNAPNVSGTASTVSSGDEFYPQDTNLTIGLSVTWNILDGGLTRGLVEEARGNVTVAQAQLYTAQQTVRSDVANAYVNLRAAEQRVAVAQADVANAQQGVQIATGRYSTGLGLFLDIINAQAFLVTANTNLVTVLSAVDQYRVALEHSVGVALPHGR